MFLALRNAAMVGVRTGSRICVSIPMTKADRIVEATVEESGCESRQLDLGPRSQGDRLLIPPFEKDDAARNAIVCPAFGTGMPIQCEGCGQGPSGKGMMRRNKSNAACSNCILRGASGFASGEHDTIATRTKSTTTSRPRHDAGPNPESVLREGSM